MIWRLALFAADLNPEFSNLDRNAVLNAVGGVLGGYGITAFLSSAILDEIWEENAPKAPNIAKDLIYSHNEHGSIT